jgi:hypothetical protein
MTEDESKELENVLKQFGWLSSEQQKAFGESFMGYLNDKIKLEGTVELYVKCDCDKNLLGVGVKKS